jgi:hypothetical protein
LGFVNIPTLSKLLPVDVHEVWPMEASSFTPWLMDNAEALAEILGIEIELEEAEHKVGNFSLDLIGRDQDTGDVVIIENQFGQTDHRHLGQILTYAGGTNPTTVVWIAESFREEHRAALDWLNERTDDETRFFGVKLSAVTLEGAPAGLIAPFLEVVAKPNEWGKQVKRATESGQATGTKKLYQQFWAEWLERVAGRHWTNKRAPAQSWLNLPAGSKKAHFKVSFRSDGVLSELFFHHADPEVNRARWSQLVEKRAALEESFGGALVFDELPSK